MKKVKKKTSEIGEVLKVVKFLKANMATKSELSSVKSELSSVKSELSSVKSELSSVKVDTSSVKGELSEVVETVNFMKDRMVTKGEVREIVEDVVEGKLKPTNDRLSAVENKVTGIYNLLEDEARNQTDLKIPRRMHDVEEKVFGRGNSKHPKHVALS